MSSFFIWFFCIQLSGPEKMKCPRCGSEDISLAEREYTHDYPFWIVLAAAFILIGGTFLLFLFLQLHPVILILISVAAISWLLDTGNRRRQKFQKTEYICLRCDQRFKKNNGDGSISSESEKKNRPFFVF